MFECPICLKYFPTFLGMIFTLILRRERFVGKESEVKSGEVTCPRSFKPDRAELEFQCSLIWFNHLYAFLYTLLPSPYLGEGSGERIW